MAIGMCYPWKCVLFLVSLIMLVSVSVFAATPLSLQSGAQSSSATWKPDYHQVSARYHYLVEEDMNETYQAFYGGNYGIGTWQLGDKARGRVGLRGDVGLMLGVGKPIVLDDTWTINSSELQALVAPVSTSLLYRFVGEKEHGFLSPYVGIGIGGIFGFERIAVDVSRVPEGQFDWHDTKFRASFEGHALLGVLMGTGDGIRGVLEVEWIQGGKGSLKSPSLTEEELAEGWGEVVEDFQGPGFSFTGVSVSLGVKW